MKLSGQLIVMLVILVGVGGLALVVWSIAHTRKKYYEEYRRRKDFD